MRVFGNLMNRIDERLKSPAPEVGMGATILMYSDRDAATIVTISDTRKLIGVQRDKFVRTDENGMSEDQTYEFTPNPAAHIEYFTLRHNGQWIRQGETLRNGLAILLGRRDKYRDFSF